MTMHAVPGLPPPPAHVHFVGIGGIGMSGLARMLHAWGYRVTGSDSAPSDQTEGLIREGMAVSIGHAGLANAANADLLVMTSALRSDNPEVAAARMGGVRIVKRAELLGRLAETGRSIAVAGSHGKSTTSGMVVSALIALGARASYAIGAIVASTGVNAAPGDGDLFVVEADEYDRSFLQLSPDVAVINNIDYDHPDIYADLIDYDAAFLQFAQRVRKDGALVIAADDPGCAHLLARPDFPADRKVVTFGETAGVDWQLRFESGLAEIAPRGSAPIPLRLTVPGRHNFRNATAAVASLAQVGFTAEEAVGAVSTFRGIGRRFETKGDEGGILVVDDYAHHPGEIRATLRAARERYPERRIVAVFQPHTYSRTKALLVEFADAFEDADVPVILDIYPSRETDTLGVSSGDILTRMAPGALAGGTLATAVPMLMTLLQPGDLVLTLGAGDVTQVGPAILERLRQAADPADDRPST